MCVLRSVSLEIQQGATYLHGHSTGRMEAPLLRMDPGVGHTV